MGLGRRGFLDALAPVVRLDFVLACLAVALLAFATLPRPITDAPPTRIGAPPVQALGPGRSIDLPRVVWSASDVTLILYIWTSCSACDEGASLYRSLATLAEGRPDLRLVVAAPDPADPLAQWLSSHGIEPEHVLNVEDAVAHGILVFPTLLSVDSQGQIIDLFAGPIDEVISSHIISRYASVSLIGLETSRYSVPSIPEGPAVDHVQVQSAQFLILDDRTTPWIGVKSAASIRMPPDEVRLRVPYEFDPLRPIAIECRVAIVDCRSATLSIVRAGYQVVAMRPATSGDLF